MLKLLKNKHIGDRRSIDVHSHLQNLQRITSIHSPRLLNHSIRLSRYGHDLPCGLDFCGVFLNSSKFCRSDDFVAVGQTNEYNLCANRTNATNAIFMCLVLLCSTLVQSQNSVRVRGERIKLVSSWWKMDTLWFYDSVIHCWKPIQLVPHSRGKNRKMTNICTAGTTCHTKLQTGPLQVMMQAEHGVANSTWPELRNPLETGLAWHIWHGRSVNIASHKKSLGPLRRLSTDIAACMCFRGRITSLLISISLASCIDSVQSTMQSACVRQSPNVNSKDLQQILSFKSQTTSTLVFKLSLDLSQSQVLED